VVRKPHALKRLATMYTKAKLTWFPYFIFLNVPLDYSYDDFQIVLRKFWVPTWLW
jgi:hypothetical protein